MQLQDYNKKLKHSHVYYIKPTTDFCPFFLRALRRSAAKLKAARKNFNDLMEQEALKGGPQKDSTIRICNNYTLLNKVTVTMS